jgi:uncharacterized membrane protein
MNYDHSITLEEKSYRIQSIDVVRGLIMVLMAIDHVRVYSGVPPGGPDPGVFFTRWVTHFCAPGFAFLAGTSAFLYGQKVGKKSDLAWFLITRGLLLAVLELTVLRFLWSFNFNFSEFILAGVIWMLGWCMVILAAFVWLDARVVGVLGVLVIVFQKVFAYVPSLVKMPNGLAKVWEFVYPSGTDGIPNVFVLYVLVPWIGVMTAGYGFGVIMAKDKIARKKWCLSIGLSCTLLFLILGSIQIMNDPAIDGPPFIFRLLNQLKYPASPLFLLMTLGPIIAVLPFLEKSASVLASALKTIGRVPFFFYLLHILVIHLSALLVQLVHDGGIHSEWFMSAPFTSVPEESRWSLGLLYLVFFLDIIVLFIFCRWYQRYKNNNEAKTWLRYL